MAKIWNKSGYTWYIQSAAHFIQGVFSRAYNVSDIMQSSVTAEADMAFQALHPVSQLIIRLLRNTIFAAPMEGHPYFHCKV